MTATYVKNMGKYRITLDRTEVEIVAYSGTRFSDLLTALSVFTGNEFTIFGSKADIESILRK